MKIVLDEWDDYAISIQKELDIENIDHIDYRIKQGNNEIKFKNAYQIEELINALNFISKSYNEKD